MPEETARIQDAFRKSRNVNALVTLVILSVGLFLLFVWNRLTASNGNEGASNIVDKIVGVSPALVLAKAFQRFASMIHLHVIQASCLSHIPLSSEEKLRLFKLIEQVAKI